MAGNIPICVLPSILYCLKTRESGIEPGLTMQRSFFPNFQKQHTVY